MRPLNYLKHAWNAFASEEKRYLDQNEAYGNATYLNPTRRYFTGGNERSLITSVYNRIAIDAASIDIRHVKLDANKRMIEEIPSGLNECLTVEANLDQTAASFIQDVAISMMDIGHVVIVPVDTTIDPTKSNTYNINTMRTGRVTTWYPDRVRVELYNDRTGMKEEVTLPKRAVAIIENPFYAVMNEPNSTMQRLKRKLNYMDELDAQSVNGSMDLIIQLPYAVKSEAKKAIAQERRKDLEEQLNGSRYGVGYIDASEKVTQLNRAVENNFVKEVKFLTEELFAQLGITQEILNGTADEDALNNYFMRTVEPIVGAMVDAMNRTFLTKTARTQGQAITYFRDPFKLMSVSNIAEIADKFTRNEIMSSNEIRQIVGMKPSDDPKADELRNKNLSQSKTSLESEEPKSPDEQLVEETSKIKMKKDEKKQAKKDAKKKEEEEKNR